MAKNPALSVPLKWAGALQPGDIVAFRFPHQWKGGSDVPKVRPALVIEVFEQNGHRSAVLAYGTSNAGLRTDANTLDVQVAAEIEKASLKKPTRFHVSRRIRVPLDDSGFVLKPSIRTPVLGRLSGRSQKRLTDIRTSIHSNEMGGRRGYLSRNRKERTTRPQLSINDQHNKWTA